ncbi:galactosylceramide sulfotransferase-like [Penaeus indicus]|uniref:galactosylceramide sulfotransferase-like n=1 Tax=Penaeus indicus TaxID=29960 RepID=UPI00300C6B78
MKTFFILLKLLLVGTAISLLIYSAVSSKQPILWPRNVSLEVKEIPATTVAQCSPHNHVMFIKTQKCGSSTLQNIFLRYGYKNNLTFALPTKGNMLGYPNGFKPSMIPKHLLPPGGKTDIFALHTRVSYREQRMVLHKDTRWITVLREPASQFESFYNYFNLKRYFKKNLAEFKNIPVANISLPRKNGLFGKNQMTFVMGYPDSISGEPLRRALENLDRLFDQVLIYEHWDESLILLRHLLCWSLHGVVAFKKNARGKRKKLAIDAELRRTLRELNYADVELYEHFLAKHRRQVLAFGVERMAKEVLSLTKLREDYSRRCAPKKKAKGRAPERGKNTTQAKGAANAMAESCYLLSLSEIPLIKAVREKQIRMLSGSKKH